MDTLTSTMLTSGTALDGYRWNSLSPSPLSDNEDEEEYCRRIKVEHPFEVDSDAFFRNAPPPGISHQMHKRTAPCTAIPLASCATAAASLSSAFCKRSNGFTKPVSMAAFIYLLMRKQLQSISKVRITIY
ncbi:unnamed protein product [Toxocara canis]|uniref:Uncharacterized protein n=1 Tax=Toxocara canis TaxID=6265 RepID=A0A183UDT7_TOXCA|nr:unnamed protein product [Toxocara canis]